MKIRDALFLPLRIFLSNDKVTSLGLTSILEERINICADHVVTPILDIGCGEGNPFIRRKDFAGYGMDIFPYKDIDICSDVLNLPFKKNSFKTVSFIGSFNYIKNTDRALQEVKEILDDGGKLLITVTNAFWSRFRHAVTWWKKEQYVIKSGMKYSFSNKELMRILDKNGFKVKEEIRYLVGVSKLFIVQSKQNTKN